MLKRLQFLTSGESHGRGLLGILDGLPAGIEITENYINLQLKRRQHLQIKTKVQLKIVPTASVNEMSI